MTLIVVSSVKFKLVEFFLRAHYFLTGVSAYLVLFQEVILFFTVDQMNFH